MRKILSLYFMTYSIFAELPTIIPPSLKEGDLIAIVFPASFPDLENTIAEKLLDTQAKWLQAQGYRTIFYPDKVNRVGYLAGTDTERANALMSAWENREVKAIWCFQGGYGAARILDKLDYDLIQANPKIFIGMSDITALHQAIQLKTGLVTFLAPILRYFNNQTTNFNDEYALFSLKSLLSSIDQNIFLPTGFDIEVINPGIGKGKLVGGNLSLITALCGTKWQLNTEGKILLLEDIEESIFQIDRMLWQLEKSGLLDRPAAVILASWAKCKPKHTYTLTLKQVFEHYFKNANYPVISNFPSGHIEYQLTLPLNTMMEVNALTKTVSILEPAVFETEETGVSP